jgi:linoleoyl-CoA desaturase
MSSVTFNNKKSPFFRALKAKVDSYFADNQVKISGNRKLHIKSFIQVSCAVLTYITLVFFNPGTLISIFLCALFGANLAVLGFNVMHEGGHASFSKYKWINRVSAYSLNFMGGNAYFWKLKHNAAHHTFTNIEGADSDIEVKYLMRLSDSQPRFWFHKFQDKYWFILYGVSYIAWVYYQDFTKYFTGKIAEWDERKTMIFKEHAIFWLTKILYTIIYIVVPILMLGFWKALIGYVIAGFVCGLCIATVFQLAHVVESTQFPTPDAESNKIETEWAIHQVATTANFGTKSKLLYWLLGGLNFQVEHHLFPKISHVHYPKISQFVKETCEQFNVPYLEYSSAQKALASHLHHIKRLGRA